MGEGFCGYIIETWGTYNQNSLNNLSSQLRFRFSGSAGPLHEVRHEHLVGRDSIADRLAHGLSDALLALLQIVFVDIRCRSLVEVAVRPGCRADLSKKSPSFIGFPNIHVSHHSPQSEIPLPRHVVDPTVLDSELLIFGLELLGLNLELLGLDLELAFLESELLGLGLDLSNVRDDGGDCGDSCLEYPILHGARSLT